MAHLGGGASRRHGGGASSRGELVKINSLCSMSAAVKCGGALEMKPSARRRALAVAKSETVIDSIMKSCARLAAPAQWLENVENIRCQLKKAAWPLELFHQMSA